ncbi:Uncharacterised protein [Chryseobacterium nakagawai]|nr:Uncharacterised protein [Chryseobacterium nakagawai]
MSSMSWEVFHTTKRTISLNSDVIGTRIVNVKASFEEKTLFNTTSLY